MKALRVSVLSPLFLGLSISTLAVAQGGDAPEAPPDEKPPAEGDALAAPEPPEAAPAETKEDADKRKAREVFFKGVEAFRKGSIDVALVEFQRSLSIYPTITATKNAAICLRELKRFDESLEMWERLRDDFKDLRPEEKTEAESNIKDLAAFVGTVEVRGAMAGARVLIDGRDRGALPAKPIRVSAGTRFVRVSMEGFVPFETQVRVAGGQNSVVEAKLQALTQGGRLKITEQSGKAVDVVVDNVVVGKTPWEGTLSVGDHTVWLKGEGNLGTQPAAAPIKLNQVTALALAVEELSAELRVEPTPVGATVAVDGVTVGRGVWDGRLRAGRHKVEVAAEGFIPKLVEITIGAGKRRAVSPELERDPESEIWKKANPPRFYLELDGGLAVAPALGGDVVDGCTGGCSSGLPLGFAVLGTGGYQLSSGLGFGLEGGYLQMQQKVEGRDVSLQPQGLEANPGTADDTLTLKGLLVGASAQFHRGDSFAWLVRLGGGVFLGTLDDERRGDATTVERTVNPGTPQEETIPAQPYDFSVSESQSATYVYVAPEARVGWRPTERLELSAGLRGMFLFALGQPEWKDEEPVVPGSQFRVGQLTFGSDALAGTTVLVAVPTIGARYEL